MRFETISLLLLILTSFTFIITSNKAFENIKYERSGFIKDSPPPSPSPPMRCNIAAICLLRIYEKDKAELSTLETEQWIHYMLFAGVDKIYLYDAFERREESIKHWVSSIGLSNVFYIDWHEHTPYTLQGTHVSAYQHALDHVQCDWHIAMDIDEYPFVIEDKTRGFLRRLMKNATHSEYSFENYVFSGAPQLKTWLAERVFRRYPNKFNQLSKPIYRPTDIKIAQMHHNILKKSASRHVSNLT